MAPASPTPTRWLALATFACFALVGCSIAPVVSTQEPSARYQDCERAARDYCEESVQASGSELDKCVAEARFKCVSGSSQ